MKIVVNGKFFSQRITGVQRYARELVKELDKICNDVDIEIAVPKDTVDLPVYQNIKIAKIGKFTGNIWEQISFSRYVKQQNAISLNLCNSAPLTGKKVVTIHDVKIKVHPEFFSKKFLLWYKFLFNNITKRALKVITVSEFSKSEILKYYKIPSDKIRIVSNSWQHFKDITYDENVFEKYGLQRFHYYFSISSLEPNKNLNWIINIAQNNNAVFAIAGGVNKKVFASKNIDLPSNIKLLGYVSDSEAKTLMRDSKAFLYPTFYEGFGIPPLEALAANASAIIVSDNALMHEIYEDKAIYINPEIYEYNIDELVSNHKIEEVEKESVLNKYSWEISAKRLLDLLSEIVAKNNVR